MAWNCPRCKKINTDAEKKCVCGYAFYEVLGLKEDASEQSIEQAYQYLEKVWTSSSSPDRTGARAKTDERIQKIHDAYAVFRQMKKGTGGEQRRRPLFLVGLGAGAIVLIAGAAFFLLTDSKPATRSGAPAPTAAEQVPAGKAGPGVSQQPSSEQQPAQQSAERRTEGPDMRADKTPDWAIESVKNSHILDRFSSVETIVAKWTKENAEKLKVVGWIAKKVDEQFYLVTYTATDGIMPTGFFFELNSETGEIRNIAGNAELQQKYGIKGR